MSGDFGEIVAYSPFLTRFLHANNAGVRVVILGATRLFMRGSTAQFRDDMMVSGFPFSSAAAQLDQCCLLKLGEGIAECQRLR
jgi:hypothetical protein